MCNHGANRRVPDGADGVVDARAEILRVCSGYLEATLEPGVRQILLIDAPAVLGPAADALDHELTVQPFARASAVMRESGALADVDVEALAHLISGSLAAVAIWIGRSPDPHAVIARAMATLDRLLDGVF